jgi:hypothetical protein
MQRKILGSFTALLVVVGLAQPASAVIQKVRDGAVREYGFAIDRTGGGDVVRAWAQDSAQHPYRFSVYYQAGGDPAVRLSALSTTADLGGLDLTNSRGSLLSYDAYNRASGNYDVKFYDVVDGHPVAVPDGVNTNAWDTHPTVSGDDLLFQRGNRFGPKRVILINMQTSVSTELAVAPTNGIVLADQVTGDYAVYTVCPRNGHCVVRRYQISTQTKVRVPDANRAAYSPSVTSDGDVYYVIGHPTRCGVNTQIHRWTGGSGATKIEQLPNGIDVPSTWAYEPQAGGVKVYFTRMVCLPRGGFRSGIYVTEG